MDQIRDIRALSCIITHAQRIAEYASAALWTETHQEHLFHLAERELEMLAEAAGFRLVPVKDTTSEEPA